MAQMKPSMLLLLVVLVVVVSALSSSAATDAAAPLLGNKFKVKTQTFLSPPFFLRPGGVTNKWYYDVDFPRGHVALKSFNGEVVDELGDPVPLHETYLHHWLVSPYYYSPKSTSSTNRTTTIPAPNSGPCKDSLGQYFGLGSETRRTSTWVPDPYGIEVGGAPPADVPEGYELRWFINVHAIDTRGGGGGADTLACTECRCDAYNVTVDEEGRRIGDGYVGGLHCCYDRTRCGRVVVVGDDDNADRERKLFLRYTVSWVDWSDAVVPVRIYILDVTDTALLDGGPKPYCKVEYTVDACDENKDAEEECVDVRATKEVVPRGGDLVYAVAHQHRGGVGSSLRGEDGRLLCESTPIYGTGRDAGDEEGYIVGMTTCYPTPGTVKVRDGEALTVVSSYSSERQHTGVMGHFYILLADQQEQDNKIKQPSALCFSYPVPWCLPRLWSNQL